MLLRETPDLHTWDALVTDSQGRGLSVGLSSQKVKKGRDLVFYTFFFSEGFAIGPKVGGVER